MTKEALQILLEKYYKGQCSPEETVFIDQLLDGYVDTHEFELSEEETTVLSKIVREGITRQTGISLAGEAKTRPGKLRRLFFKRGWLAVAAMLVLVLGAYFYFQNMTTTNKLIVSGAHQITEVKPGTTKATLLLADGQEIALDSTHDKGVQDIQVRGGYVCVLHKNGQKVYLNKSPQTDVYNSLVTKRGQQAPPMTLSDGTKVWLNASSVLHFPVQFSGNTREVALTGEAYFEVAKDASHPFIVKAGDNKIRVLGTHFDVMAYNDEPNIYATLLEGSILINHNNKHEVKLRPGQQGIISGDGNIEVKNVEAEASVAWLHGKLPMDNMDVKAFLREVSRWYDVDISYKGQIAPQSFSGNLNRNVPLSHILSALEANGIKCELKNRTITVSQ